MAIGYRIDEDKMIRILNMGIGYSSLEDEHEILEKVLNKHVAKKALNSYECSDCKFIVFDSRTPMWVGKLYCSNCGQLVKR